MSHIKEEFWKIENESGWNALFRKLANEHHMNTINKRQDIALLNVNKPLNRFRDVLPYDDTRVCLKQGNNDYINASYVQVSDAKRTYILTQGPLQSTSSHFWQMVWEQNSRVIVMLTGLIEKGQTKCCVYYPDSEVQKTVVFDDVGLQVTFVSERQYRHYTQRKFHLTKLSSGELHPIIHWSDFDWPDHGAPSNPEPFLQLLNDVRHCGAFDSRYGPLILHCSAGIGRSGTFVLVDSILKLLSHDQNRNNVSIADVLLNIRTQRQGLIQTAEQLRFSYVAILAGLKSLNEIEKSEAPFSDCHFQISSESENESENEDERYFYYKNHPKICGRQDNIMPCGRLSEDYGDINCELIKRVDSAVSSYEPSPITPRRLNSSLKASNALENVNDKLQSSPLFRARDDMETPFHRRSACFGRNEHSESDVNGKVTNSHSPSSISMEKQRLSLFSLLTTKYRGTMLIGALTVLTGSLIIYQRFSKNDRTQ